MELRSLRAPRPPAPKLSVEDKRVQIIVRDLEKIRLSKPRKQLRRCQSLVHYVAQTLRRAEHDHLLHATAIWALIHVFRLFPAETKPTMLEAGVPGVLLTALREASLSGTSRQYASELCFYLSSSSAYPDKHELPPLSGPITSFPEALAAKRYAGELDEVSVRSDVSSEADAPRGRAPFVPFRLNDAGLAKIDALFEGRKEIDDGASLPSHHLLSQFGFSQYKKKRAADMNFYQQQREMRDNLRAQRRAAKDKDNGKNVIAKGDTLEESSSESSSEDDFGKISDEEEESDDEKREGAANRERDDDASSVVSSLSSGSRSQTPSAQSELSLPSRAQTASFLSLRDRNTRANGLTSSLLSSPQRESQGRSSDSKAQKQRSSLSASISAPVSSPFRLGRTRRDEEEEEEEDVGIAIVPHNKSKKHVNNEDHDDDEEISRSRRVSSAPFRAVQQLRSHDSLSHSHNLYDELERQHELQKAREATPATPYDSWVSSTKTLRQLGSAGFGDLPTRVATPMIVKKPLQRFADAFAPATAPATAMKTSQSVDSLARRDERERKSSTLNASVSMRLTESRSGAVTALLRDLDPLSLSLTQEATQREELTKSRSIALEREGDEEKEGKDEDDEEESDDAAYGLRRGHCLESDDEKDTAREGDGDAERENTQLAQRRLRLRAEKLIDHQFVKALFVKRTTASDAQDLIRRMEQLLALLDPQRSGYVTFEQFTRLILAVAPRHLLRADIEAFMRAQTRNDQDLVDYTEFVISGKVLLLTKAQLLQQKESAKEKEKEKKNNKKSSSVTQHTESTTAVWLKRQRQFVGNASTYTWKNHLRWYSARKAQAVIWLVRRATRAFAHEQRLQEAERFLLLQRKHAIAMTALMEYGHAALQAKELRVEAKRRLLKRVIQARKHIQKTQEAQFFLAYSAKGALREWDYLEKIHSIREQSRQQIAQQEEDAEAERMQHLFRSPGANKKKKQVDYGTIFKIRELQKIAIRVLRERATHALRHSARQEEALLFIRTLARKVQTQFVLKDRARRELVQRATAAYEFCSRQDQAFLALNRVGNAALQFMHRKLAALQWLQERGRESILFLASQSTAKMELAEIGRHTLSFMNARERAFAYLDRRRAKARVFIERRAEAVEFLRTRPAKLWAAYEKMNVAQEWLANRAKRAREYDTIRLKAAASLQYTASKATRTFRRQYIAFQELSQMGLLAKVEVFKRAHKRHATLRKMVDEERKKIAQRDAQQEKERRGWSSAERLKIELAEAMQILHSIYTPPSLAMKTPLQRLEAITNATAPSAVETMTSTVPMNALVPMPAATAALPPSSPSSSALVLRRTATAERPQTVSSSASRYLIGKYAFRKLVAQGKLFQKDLIAVDECFRNMDYSSSCYVPMAEILPWFEREAAKVKNFRFRVQDTLSVEERAAITIFLLYLKDKDLLAGSADSPSQDKKKKKRKKNANRFEEAASKYGAGRTTQRASYLDSEEESGEDEDAEEEDEDALFSDLEKLQNCDVGKLMRYLTRKKEEEIERERKLLEASKANKPAPIALNDNTENAPSVTVATDQKPDTDDVSDALKKPKVV